MKARHNRFIKAGIAALMISSSSMMAAAEGKPQGLPAEVIKVAQSTLTSELRAVGKLEAWESAVIRPEQNGVIEKVLFEESQSVKAGDTLFELEASTYRAAVAEARARVSLSQSEYKRADQLLKKRVGSATERDTALAQLRVNEAQLQVAQTQLAKMRIKAPFDGVIALRSVSPGDYVTAGQDLVELADISKMKVEFSLPEIALSQISRGQQINLQIPAYPNETFSGEIYTISPLIDPRSHSIKVKARIENSSGKLRPGLFSKIKVLLGTDDQALLVPEEAIIPNNNTFLVMKVDENNTVGMVPVQLGVRKDAKVQVISGLNTDDVIVTAGHIKLRPGMPITPIFPQPAKQEG
ncbi:efflux RND transporter periplasmic adaptor subunit [Neptunomonas marina]|uniref:Efflux RND transporter periplasmic adaptor subunit n=1 Tax=Neptunomonas marina TaxID=1815562 RepID=A0A437Q7U6_9GAMM|nr:efflux RND transporter periplasmic adaptor subunit [Neptunomonas marina]RVU30546.1 efflux RND transporter periplasmic adaptor subunit [Neptunomonas marina]